MARRRIPLPRAGTKLYCLVAEARVCEQLAQCGYLAVERPGVELTTSRVASQRLNHYTTGPNKRNDRSVIRDEDNEDEEKSEKKEK